MRQFIVDVRSLLKRASTYLLIAAVNLVLLTILLALWTDKLQQLLDSWRRPLEFLKIIGFSFISLVGMRVLVYFFRKKKIKNVHLKIKIASLLTFLISCYLYVYYSVKVINHVIVNGQSRRKAAKKIKPANQLAYGTRAEQLTLMEYTEISKITRLPPLPDSATNIDYTYSYDGFLPDYSFELSYDLPEDIAIDSIDYKKGDISKYQSFMIVNHKKRVSYSETKN